MTGELAAVDAAVSTDETGELALPPDPHRTANTQGCTERTIQQTSPGTKSEPNPTDTAKPEARGCFLGESDGRVVQTRGRRLGGKEKTLAELTRPVTR